jgi:hypothetical protein
MNKLVEYLETHHDPYGDACIHVRVETITEETGWTREEIWDLAKEPEEKNQLTRSYRGVDWSELPSAENMDTVCLWNRIYWKK